MSLSNLDYLASVEGGKAFFVIFTAAQASANKVDIETPEQLDDLIWEIIEDNKDLYGGDEEKAGIIFHAIDDVFYSTVLSQQAVNATIDQVQGIDEPILKLTMGLLMAAAHINIVNETNPNMMDHLLGKRNFIRKAALMYETATIAHRNRMMIRGDSPGKFQ